jgi:hypothetical protein
MNCPHRGWYFSYQDDPVPTGEEFDRVHKVWKRAQTRWRENVDLATYPFLD